MRWICFQAPDLVLEIQSGSGSVVWECNAAARHLAPAVAATREIREDSLLRGLGEGYPEGLGTIPGLRLTASREQLSRELSRLFGAVQQDRLLGPSSARQTLAARRGRSCTEVGRVLSTTYGHTFQPVVYTQGVPISDGCDSPSWRGANAVPMPIFLSCFALSLTAQRDMMDSEMA